MRVEWIWRLAVWVVLSAVGFFLLQDTNAAGKPDDERTVEGPVKTTPASELHEIPFEEPRRTGWSNLKSDGMYLLTFPTRKTRRGVVTTSAILGGATLLVLLDDEIYERVHAARTDSLDDWQDRIEPAGRSGTLLLGAASVYTAGRVSGNERIQETGRALVETLILVDLFKTTGKQLIGRDKPDPGVRASGFFDGGSVFPSGHTARAFAFATVLAERHGRRAGWVAYPLATLVGLCTIQGDAHWASDVLAGGALGWAMGKAVTRRRAARENGYERFTITPGVSAWGQSPAVGVRIAF